MYVCKEICLKAKYKHDNHAYQYMCIYIYIYLYIKCIHAILEGIWASSVSPVLLMALQWLDPNIGASNTRIGCGGKVE